MANLYFPEQMKIVPGFTHAVGDSTTASDRISLENYARVAIYITHYQGGANAGEITIHKATTDGTAVEDTTNTVNYWYLADWVQGTTVDTWTKGTAAATIATSGTASGTSYYLIDIGADELPDSTADYKFLEVNFTGGHNSSRVDCAFILYNPRYQGATLLTAQS